MSVVHLEEFAVLCREGKGGVLRRKHVADFIRCECFNPVNLELHLMPVAHTILQATNCIGRGSVFSGFRRATKQALIYTRLS